MFCHFITTFHTSKCSIKIWALTNHFFMMWTTTVVNYPHTRTININSQNWLEKEVKPCEPDLSYSISNRLEARILAVKFRKEGSKGLIWVQSRWDMVEFIAQIWTKLQVSSSRISRHNSTRIWKITNTAPLMTKIETIYIRFTQTTMQVKEISCKTSNTLKVMKARQ